MRPDVPDRWFGDSPLFLFLALWFLHLLTHDTYNSLKMFSTLALKQATVSMLMEYSNSQSSMARHSACSWIPSQSFPAPSSLYTKSCLLLLLGFCLWKSITNEYRAYTKAEAFAPQLSVLNALWCLWICVVCTDQVFAWNFFFCLHDWHKPFANIMF